MTTQLTEKDRHKFFYEEVGEIAFIFLANMMRFNLDSRRYMANAIFNGIYTPVEDRQGELAQIDENSRRQLLDVVTLDILTKVFMAVEDLGKILLTTGKPLKAVPATMLDASQIDSLAAITRYSQKTERQLMEVFPFLHPREYGLAGEHESAILSYNQHHAAMFKKILTFAADFVQRHTWAYNKYKHGLSMILAMHSEPLAPGIDGTVPIFTNASDLTNGNFILTGHAVVDKLIGFLGSIVELSQNLVERKLQIAELGGTPPLLLCHTSENGNQIMFRPYGWGTFDEASQKASVAAFDKTIGAVTRTKIVATLNVNADPVKIQDWVNFYSRDWRVT
jgi:hypothetical protein